MATKLIDLIEDITQDDLPTNLFTIEDEDPMVILGKLNEVIAWLKELDIDNVEDILELIASKVAKTTQANRVYATDNNGDQTTIEIGTTANQIPKYDADARLKTSTPSANDDVANKKYVDDADALKQDALTETQLNAVNSGIDNTKVGQIANKVDKVTSANQVYATDNTGNQTTIDYQSSQTDGENKIVQRDANGDVLVPSTPTSNNGATSKNYVDSLINNIANYSTNEVAIGKWIDNSTIYKKVFSFNADNNNSWHDIIDVTSLNIKWVTKLYGVQFNGYERYFALPVGEGTYYRNLCYNPINKSIQTINSGYEYGYGYIVIEYIKN